MSETILTAEAIQRREAFLARARAVYGPEATWSYIQASRAWYHDNLTYGTDVRVDEIWIRLSDTPEPDKHGVIAEFGVTWRDLNAGHDPDPEVHLYDDAWALLPLLPEFFAGLAALAPSPRAVRWAPAHPDQVIDLLNALGMADQTPVTRPDF